MFQEQCAVGENTEPVKKTRRPSRRRTVRVQEETSSELSFGLSQAVSETSKNGDGATEKVSSLPLLGEGIQRKPRRRRVATCL